MIAGPGIKPANLPMMTSIPDLAPTFIELAGGDPSQKMDGKSLVPLLLNERSTIQTWRDSVLVEYYATTTGADVKHIKDHLKDSGNNTFIGLRIKNSTLDLVYMEFTDVASDWAFEHSNFCEMYNITADPNQFHNLCLSRQGEMASGLIPALHKQLYNQYSCRAESCV